jgi:dTDP-4-dehydrorhamnose reductase
MRKKILVIGKYGQIAQYLPRCAHDVGFDVVALSKEELDIRNPEFISLRLREVRPDIVINTAAYHVVGECEAHPQEAYAMNTFAVAHLAVVCKEFTIPFFTYSSDYVFDGIKGERYDEFDKPYPLQVYGKSKYAGERAALVLYPEGTFVIRTAGVYGGQGSRSKKGNLVLNLLEEAKTKQSVHAAGNMTGSPSFAGHVARATIELITHNAPSGIYHLVNEGSCTWHEFASHVYHLTNASAALFSVNRSGEEGGIKRPLRSPLLNSKARNLGIELPHWKRGLEAYLHEQKLIL